MYDTCKFGWPVKRTVQVYSRFPLEGVKCRSCQFWRFRDLHSIDRYQWANPQEREDIINYFDRIIIPSELVSYLVFENKLAADVIYV